MAEADELLLEWAGAVADGRVVDWEAASSSEAAPDLRLRHLQTLAAIARACRMPPAPPAPAAGVLFRWCHLEIRERIGKGVYGEVFRGWDTKLEREVAVKFLSAEAAAAVPHALQEGRHLARVRHPGVVMVFGAEEQDGRVGIWMEYVHGHTLEQWLEERGPFTSHEAILVGIDLCRALAAVHRANLVHRDVKTRNVVREDTGRIVLMDFGAGVDFRSGHETREVAGTPIYLAPEVLRGDPASPQSDLYGLGVLLYRLVTRSYPFSGTTLEALQEAHQRGALRPLHEARNGLPAAFRRVVERALAPDLAARFASAGQMEAALAAALEEPRRAARRRTAIVAVAAAVAAAALGIALAGQRARTAPPAAATTPPTVAVADVVNELPDQELDALSGMLTTSLDQGRGLRVLTRSRLTDILAATGRAPGTRIDAPLGIEICRRERAVALLVPSVRPLGAHYRVSLEALDPRRGKLMFTASAIAAGKDRVPAAIDTLSQRVRAALGWGPAGPGAAVPPVALITTPSLSAYSRYDRAERLIDRLEMAAARAQLEQAVALDSTFALAHARLAYVCWWMNDEPGERTHLASAFARIDRVPERHRFHLRAQGAMADRQGLEVARSILLEMERFYPDDKEMLYDIGDYSSHLNEFPQAIQYLERVIAMDPGFARAIQHLTRVYRDLGRREPYLEWAKHYAAADSTWDSYVLLGNALVAAGDVESGIEMLARGRARAPDHGHDFTMSIARSRILEGRLAEGRRVFDGLVGSASTPALRGGALRERALGRIHQGACAGALADLEEAAEIARRDRDAAVEARTRIEAAVLLMVALNDSVAASRQVRRCVSLEGAITYRGNYFHFWPYWGSRFKLHLIVGDLLAAETLARQKFGPDKWYGPYVEAYLHAARGHCAQAAAAASRVLEWGPADENIALLHFLARCQLEHRDAAGAVESLQRLQGLYSQLTLGTPYYAAGLRLLGEACERRGDPESAARSYARLLELWREGDSTLPDRLEAQRRLARLRTPLAAAGPEP